MTKKNQQKFKNVNKLIKMNNTFIYLPEVLLQERTMTEFESGVSTEGKEAFRVEPAKFNTTPQTKTTYTPAKWHAPNTTTITPVMGED